MDPHDAEETAKENIRLRESLDRMNQEMAHVMRHSYKGLVKSGCLFCAEVNTIAHKAFEE